MASAGLVSGDEILGDVLSRDTDKDGILDWEEGLWGTDPTKKDTNDDGVSDKEEIGRMKAERAATSGEPASADSSGEASEENLTQTDKFARELFSTVAALSQSGEIDDNTVAQITDSLASQIQNPVQRKVYTMADLKVTQDNSTQAFQKYSDDTDKIFIGRYPFDEKVADILQRFSEGGEDGDAAVLSELDPIIKNLKEMVDGMTTVNVPSEISNFHLAITNNLEKVFENLSDIRTLDSDPVLSMGAINTYPDNLAALNESVIAELKAFANRFE